MAKKIAKNQLPLDFSVHGNRIILNLGQVLQQQQAQKIFDDLVDCRWIIEPPGEAADISFAQDIVTHLGHKLPYPEGIRIAQLHQDKLDFEAFSAIYHQKGWVFLQAGADALERNYQCYLLTASLGLQGMYTTEATLFLRSEQMVFEKLLPVKEVESFFRNDIVKIPAVFASDIASYFKLPFTVILKRALQLRLITDEQYRNFMTIRPEVATKPKELFVSREGNIDDLEAQLFSEE